MNRRFYRLAAAALVPAVIFVCAADAGAKDHRRDWAEDKLEDINDDYQKAIKENRQVVFQRRTEKTADRAGRSQPQSGNRADQGRFRTDDEKQKRTRKL